MYLRIESSKTNIFSAIHQEAKAFRGPVTALRFLGNGLLLAGGYHTYFPLLIALSPLVCALFSPTSFLTNI